MPVNPIFKKSGGSLIALIMLQGQIAMAAEMPPGAALPAPVRSATSEEITERKASEPSIIEVIQTLEKKYFEHDFHSESAEERLQRLEQLIFGQSKSGDFKDRTSSLQNAAIQNDSSINASRSSTVDDNLSMLERRFFQHDFHSEPRSQRLDRLEKLAFGATKTDSIDTRIKSIKKMLQNSAELAAEDAAAAATRTENVDSKPGVKLSFNSVLEQGIKEFNAKRYHHAQEVFEKAISMNPRSAEAYANLAGTLLMLKDKQSAQECFKACYALHPFGKLGEYAREQILKLVQEDAYAKTDPQDSPQTVARTVALINRQSADRARAAQASASITARNRLTLADIEIQKMTAETRQALADFRANRGYYQYYRNGRMHNQRGTVDQYDQQEISNLDYIRTNYLRTDGQVQANLAMNDGYMRASSAYDSATNLKEQLLQPVAPGGAHLRALGTSLYARYYGDGSPSTEDPPVVDARLPGLLATPKAYNTH